MRIVTTRLVRVVLTAAVVLTGTTAVTGATAGSAFAAVPNPNPTLISRWQPCAAGTGVTVIVDNQSLGNHTVEVGCAPGDQPSGAAALKRAGFSITGTKQYGENFICRIDGLPGAGVQNCQSTPPAKAYWSYWVADRPNDAWGYSGLGAGDPNNRPRKGSVQGWAFSTAAGTTVQPRLAAVDSAGPAGARPAPLPTSTQAAAAGRAWLEPVTRALLTNAGDDALPVYVGQLISAAQALLGSGATRTGIADLLAVIRRHADEYVTQFAPGTQAFDLDRGARLLQLLTTLHDPADHDTELDLAAKLRGLVLPADDARAGQFVAGIDEDGNRGGVTFPDGQGRALRALLAATGAVPASAVRALLGQQSASGAVAPRTCGADGTELCDPGEDGFATAATAEAVLTWAAIRAAGPDAVADGTVDADRLNSAIGEGVDYLLGKQRSDGGFVGSYPGANQSVWRDAKGVGLETVLTTSTAARALAAAGRQQAARRAARWLAAMQLTERTGAPESARGLVAPGEKLFESYAANGLGYDPRTITDTKQTRTQLDRLAQLEVADAAAALTAWTAAPFVDAAITRMATTAVTRDSAHVRIGVEPGSDPQRVTVQYGTPSGTKKTVSVGTVPSGTGGRALGLRLGGLRSATTYTYQVGIEGGGVTAHSAVASFSTRGDAVVRGAGVDLPAAAGYLARGLVGGDHYESAPGFADVGLTIDGALALAAARVRGVHTGDAALRRVTAFVQRKADAWTGIGTPYAAGGSLGKVALLAQVLGKDPRTFTGSDVIAALERAVCRATSAPRCVAPGSYAYTASVFAQALGVIAQVRAGRAAARPIEYLESLQNPDGGFPALIPSGGAASEVDSTGIAAMALDLPDAPAARRAVERANGWLVRQQVADGGFPGAAGDSTNSAALAIQSLALHRASYAGAIANAQAFLGHQQNGDGGFRIASQFTVAAANRAAASVTPATASDVRASTQVVNGVVTISYATLCVTCRGGVDVIAGHVPHEVPANGSAEGARGLAATGVDAAALLRWALLLLVTGAGALAVGRRRPVRSRHALQGRS